MTRPPFIRHYEEVQSDKPSSYPGSDEKLGLWAPFSKAMGLRKLGIHYEELPPGRRTSWPHAEHGDEEFIFVIEGTPDVWIDGDIYPLRPGDAVGFPTSTGIAHTFINNSDDTVRLLVVGEADKPGNQVHYPLHPARNAEIGEMHWKNAPKRELGPHDGLPDALREKSKP